MRRFLLLLALLVAALSSTSFAQTITTGGLSAQSTDCSTANSCVVFAPTSSPSVVVQITGTFSATLQLEGTSNGTTWVAIGNAVNVGTTAMGGSNITAAGLFTIPNVGYISLRVRCSSYASGTAVVTAVRGWTAARLYSPSAPTAGAGCGTGATVAGTLASAFEVTIGTGPGSTCVLTLPAAPTGWVCLGTNQTNTGNFVKQTANSTTSVTLGAFDSSSSAANFTAANKVEVSCGPY